MNNKKIFRFEIDGIPQTIKQIETLKSILNTVTQELQYWEKPNKFAPLFKDFSVFAKGLDNNLQSLLPKIEVAN